MLHLRIAVQKLAFNWRKERERDISLPRSLTLAKEVLCYKTLHLRIFKCAHCMHCCLEMIKKNCKMQKEKKKKEFCWKNLRKTFLWWVFCWVWICNPEKYVFISENVFFSLQKMLRKCYNINFHFLSKQVNPINRNLI